MRGCDISTSCGPCVRGRTRSFRPSLDAHEDWATCAQGNSALSWNRNGRQISLGLTRKANSVSFCFSMRNRPRRSLSAVCTALVIGRSLSRASAPLVGSVEQPPHPSIVSCANRSAARAGTRAFRGIDGTFPPALRAAGPLPFIPRCPCTRASPRRSRSRTATDECGADISSTP